MKELTECLNIKRKIDEIDEKLYELRAAILSPKNQVITGMPRSGGGVDNNAIEKYIIKAERLEAKREKLKAYQIELWQGIMHKCNKAHIPKKDRSLLYFRFIKGMSWKACTNEMQKRYKKWNINTTFRRYRKTLYALETVG